MESDTAAQRLAALGLPSRLDIFTLLVKAGPSGETAGDIARALAIAPSTLTTQLAVLVSAGLATSRRKGRSVTYAVRYEAFGELLVYLACDCGQARPEICRPLARVVEPIA